MNNNSKNKFLLSFLLILLLLSNLPIKPNAQMIKGNNLQDPENLSMSIDEIIQKRTSVREFLDISITEQDLSTVLWHAYGIRSQGSHTIPQIKGEYAAIIYVLTDENVYQYDPINHSLIFYKYGDFRNIGQYTAPIQLCICWDTTRNENEHTIGMQIGAIGQNIYHTCIALNLGTVATAEIPSPIDSIGLPAHHKGKIVMPLGHPTMNTKYVKLPMWISPLPKVQDASIGFTNSIKNWNLSKPFTHTTIDRQDISQFLWACYGYSYYLDRSGFEMHFIERHRTVPSAHGYYPLELYMISSEGIYHYIPGLRNNDPFGLPIVTFLWKIKSGDFRNEFASITDEFVNDAPLSFILSLNIQDTIKWDDLSEPLYRWIWTYEVGACIQNLLLDTYAWDFTTKIKQIEQKDEINAILQLDENYDPYIIISIG